MSIFALGDPHLSLSDNKPMDVFPGWGNYLERLEKNWRAVVRPEDVVVVPGDISWAMSLEGATKDLAFLDSLPGTKVLMKGNHDYWWATAKKMNDFFALQNFTTLKVLFNNAFRFGDFTVCGTRGWFYDAETDADKKVLLRERGRLLLSLGEAKKLGGEPLVFLHYPPVSVVQECSELMDVLREASVKRCFYGHLHGPSRQFAMLGTYDGVEFSLVSADHLGFCPKLLEKF